ncbi:LysR substrate-binding domain-containing protein [Pandoraea anhela]|uniref:LysR family transcriptional regulator n=1 Tax=Pandoraea anhela TaxID=2508295 RepID=A0A5E4WF06_9BURK|nr:LysR substrate-binding domain-containing protein [Pandoraea anhela]VVE21990.1 LysR family transcriptional regulator [Pandoraea anhela]
MKALIAFEAASRTGSFAQGAEELSVSPSAISHHIQQLEEFLGVQLFQRHAGRAVLSAAGMAYAREIKHAFTLISDATALVAPQSQRGHLVIASSPSFAAKWLQPRLSGFLSAYPEVRVRLSTLSTAEDVEANRFDVGICYGRSPAGQREVAPLLLEHLRPLCSPALQASMQLSTPEDLKRVTLIHSSNALTWADYLRRVGVPSLKPANELWLDRSSMAIDAAVRGLGVVLESEVLAAEELNDGRLVAPFDAEQFSVLTTTYYLVKSSNLGNNTYVSYFEKWLRNEIALAKLTAGSA